MFRGDVLHHLTHHGIVGIEFIGWWSLRFRGGIRWHSELPTDEDVSDVDVGIKNIDSIADREAYDITLGIINIYN